jgi:hypothetical protein
VCEFQSIQMSPLWVCSNELSRYYEDFNGSAYKRVYTAPPG